MEPYCVGRFVRQGLALLPALLILLFYIPAAATDLAVTKTADAQTVQIGDTLTFTIVVDNTSTVGGGPLDSPQTVMVDDLPEGLDFISATTTKGTCTLAGAANRQVQCELGTVAKGTKVTITITARATAAGTVTNTASASGALSDPNPNNNQASVNVAIEGTPKLEIIKSSLAVEPVVGDVVEYIIVVRNIGEGPAHDVLVRDAYGLDGSANQTPVELPAGCTEVFGVGGAVDCPVGTLAPGASRELRLRMRILRYDDLLLIRNFCIAIASNHPNVDASLNIEPGSNLTEMVLKLFAGVGPTSGKHQQTLFDVYVDSVLVAADLEAGTTTTVTGFELTNISPYVHLVPAGSADLSTALLATQVDLFTGDPAGDDFYLPTSYALILVGSEENPRLLLKRDVRLKAQDPARVEFFFVHAAPEVGSIAVRLLDETPDHAVTATLLEDFRPDSLSEYLVLDPMAYNVEVVTEAGTSLDVFRLDLSEQQGAALSLALVDNEAGGAFLLFADTSGTALFPDVVTGAEASETSVPTRTLLHASYPDPFSERTLIRYELAAPSMVRLEVYDVVGRLVQTLAAAEQGLGVHEVVWDGRDHTGRPVASGMYFYRLNAGRHVETRTMLLMR